MNSRLKKAQQLSEQLSNTYQEINNIRKQMDELKKQAEQIQKQKTKNIVLGNIEEGHLVTPQIVKDNIQEIDINDEGDIEKNYEGKDKNLSIVDILRELEEMYSNYGEEYILPMGEYEFTPYNDYNGWDTLKSGIVIKTNEKYIVDGYYEFDNIEDLMQWASTSGYNEFVNEEKNQIKLKALKNLSIQQLEAMFEGKDITTTEKSLPLVDESKFVQIYDKSKENMQEILPEIKSFVKEQSQEKDNSNENIK